jgi:hypothetical protein
MHCGERRPRSARIGTRETPPVAPRWWRFDPPLADFRPMALFSPLKLLLSCLGELDLLQLLGHHAGPAELLLDPMPESV